MHLGGITSQQHTACSTNEGARAALLRASSWQGIDRGAERTACQDHLRLRPPKLIVDCISLLLCDRDLCLCLHINAALAAAATDCQALMPAMAGDWPRDPRAYGSPQHSAPPAAVRTLPSVAELLSSRPSANSTGHGHGHVQGHGNVYHHQDYFHRRSTPPATSLAAPTAGTAPAASYWNPANPHQTSPPVR